ncbi:MULTISPECIES: hypothetical protein [Pseudonocardia]|uniref:Uncharacterized protein n=2 Tax=Pseudonocardia TaxID=1847 RepID=A0A1Y2NA36_PSEAH|nr:MULTISPECIES: hypothetical protein [Pseudonocardia]OSY44091.1 hypothetical protein BG845_00212 [Pseudonocardia autotrophica]TDN74179.1 hypothetical protein C8E95_3295 [Pseudonocardia autotrophica]BBG04939.1 hypothetical protein Pdca_61480 [Pseudonocardia autotrophica]GEC23595.1 hypothetical protein PSA01_06240 [Pseudonocardia saturnea]
MLRAFRELTAPGRLPGVDRFGPELSRPSTAGDGDTEPGGRLLARFDRVATG